MAEPITILLISGSTRAGSTNTAALRTLQALAGDAVRCQLYEGLADLPALNPDDDHEPLPAAVAALRGAIAAADAVLFCTPEYAGSLPGSFKNLLDWTVGGGELYEKPVAWINLAPDGRGDGAQAHLAIVLSYLGADVVEEACRRIPIGRDALGPDGLVADRVARRALAEALAALARHVSSARASDSA